MGQVRNGITYHTSNTVGDQLQALSSMGWLYRVLALGVEVGGCMMGYSLEAKRCFSDIRFCQSPPLPLELCGYSAHR
jgi:hypothetical protein